MAEATTVNGRTSRWNRIAVGTARRMRSLRALSLSLQLVFPGAIRADVIHHAQYEKAPGSRSQADRDDLARLAAEMIEALRSGYEEGTRSTPVGQAFQDERPRERDDGRARVVSPSLPPSSGIGDWPAALPSRT